MKNEVIIKDFRDISNIKPCSAACATSKGPMILTLLGDAPSTPGYIIAENSSGERFFVSKSKLGNLLQGRKG